MIKNNKVNKILDYYLDDENKKEIKDSKINVVREDCDVCLGKGRVFNVETKKYESCKNCKSGVKLKKDDLIIQEDVYVSSDDLELYLRQNNAPVYVYSDDYRLDYSEIENKILFTDDIKEDINYKIYKRKLMELYTKALSGKEINRNYFIRGPRGFGEVELQWCLLKEYYMRGVKVSPPYLLEDLTLVVNKEKSLHSLISKYDVMQVSINNSLSREYDISSVFSMLLDKCKFENKPLIIYTSLDYRYFKSYRWFVNLVVKKSREWHYEEFTDISYELPYRLLKDEFQKSKSKFSEEYLTDNNGINVSTEEVESHDFLN